jgi:hypothetical protein
MAATPSRAGCPPDRRASTGPARECLDLRQGRGDVRLPARQPARHPQGVNYPSETRIPDLVDLDLVTVESQPKVMRL